VKAARTFWKIVTAAGMMAAVIVPGVAAAQTWEEIKARGSMSIAMDLGTPPFASTDANQKPQGLEPELVALMVKDLGIKPDIVMTNPQGRIPSLLSKKADVVVSSLAYTPERAKTIDFTDPYSLVGSVIFAPKTSKVTGLNDLAGKKVGVARGTTPDTQLTKLIGSSAEIVRFDDESSSVAALIAGQIDALGSADYRLLVLDERAAGKFDIKYEVDRFYLCMGLRKGTPELKAALNAWIAKNLDNGVIPALYQKHFKRPMAKLPKLAEIVVK
jgi:polar amino acid transport system substrate-binding protein